MSVTAPALRYHGAKFRLASVLMHFSQALNDSYQVNVEGRHHD